MNAEKTGKLINELRNRKNLTQKELAEKICISDKAVSKWERGEGCPDVSILPALAEVLGIEVESLMNGRIPVTQDISGKVIKEYNFRQPDRYPKNVQRDIQMLGYEICRKLSADYTSLLNERCECRVLFVDQMTNVEFLRSLPKDCFFYDFNYSENGFCIVADGNIGKALLKQDPEKYGPVMGFDLDVFRKFLLGSVIEPLGREIPVRTGNKVGSERFSADIAGAYGNPNSSLQDDHIMMLQLCLECSVGGVTGSVSVQFSTGILEEMTLNDFFNEAASNRVKFQSLVNIKEREMPDNVFVEFGRYSPVNVELEYGKILVLDRKETDPLNVVWENRVIHSGKTVCIDENWGLEIAESVQLNEIVYDEDDYISVQLGSAALTKEEVSGLHQGSYLLLRQRAGEMCSLIRGGEVIAYGDVCISDDMFAVRIVEVK